MTSPAENFLFTKSFDAAVDTTPSSHIRLNQARRLAPSRPSLVSFTDLLAQEALIPSPSPSMMAARSKLGMAGEKVLATPPVRSLRQSKLAPIFSHVGDQAPRKTPNFLDSIMMGEEGFCTPENQPPMVVQKLGRKLHYRTYHTEPSKSEQTSNLSFELTDYPSPRRKLWWGTEEIKPKGGPTSKVPTGQERNNRRNTIHHSYRQRRSPRLAAKEKNYRNSPLEIQEVSCLSDLSQTDHLPISSRLRSSKKELSTNSMVLDNLNSSRRANLKDQLCNTRHPQVGCIRSQTGRKF